MVRPQPQEQTPRERTSLVDSRRLLAAHDVNVRRELNGGQPGTVPTPAVPPKRKGLKNLLEANARIEAAKVPGAPSGYACPQCGEELNDVGVAVEVKPGERRQNIECPNCHYAGYRYA